MRVPASVVVCVMSPGGALAVSAMPQVCPRWGRPHIRDTRGVNDLPPCAGYRIHHTAHARVPIPGISRKFPYAQDSRIDPRCASTGLSRPYSGRSVALLLLMCSASEFWGWLRPTTFGQRTARPRDVADARGHGSPRILFLSNTNLF